MRRRWIYINGVPHEVSQDYVQPRDKTPADGLLWNDRAYQDMCDPRFKSRSEHRQYMAQNGLATMDDFKETWAAAEKKREQFYQGVDPSRKQDVAKALERTLNGSRRRTG